MRPFANQTWLWKIIDWLGDKTAIPPTYVFPLLSIQYGYGTVEKPNFRNIRFSFWRRNTASLFYNGVIFVRFALPFLICLHIRWSANGSPAFLQTVLGWKLNGRLATTFRLQSDDSAAAGMDGPNSGQARGFSDGTH